MGEWIYTPIFLTSALAGGEWSASRPCRFNPRESAPGIHLTGGWVGPIAGLDDVEKILTLPGLELRLLDRPARSQSLYRLRYPGSGGLQDSSFICKSFKSVMSLCHHNSGHLKNKIRGFNVTIYRVMLLFLIYPPLHKYALKTDHQIRSEASVLSGRCEHTTRSASVLTL
jgi:hypothetical protein